MFVKVLNTLNQLNGVELDLALAEALSRLLLHDRLEQSSSLEGNDIVEPFLCLEDKLQLGQELSVILYHYLLPLSLDDIWSLDGIFINSA